MVQELTESPVLNEQMKLRQDIIFQQARQAVALGKIDALKAKVEEMKLEIEVWQSVDAQCRFKILTLNEILRVKSV